MTGTAEKRSVADCATALRVSARGDLVAVLAGLAVAPAALVANRLLDGRIKPALVTAVALVALSFLAGAVAGARAKATGIPPHLVPASAVRWGARTGTVVFLLGSALVLLAGIAGRTAQGVAPGDFTWLGPSLAGTAGVLLAMLPAVASGSLGCLVALSRALRGARGLLPEDMSEAPEPRPRTRRGALPFAISAFLLSLASPAVPALLAGRTVPVGTVPTGGAGPAPEDFRYEAPADLSEAGASRWRIVARRALPGLRQGAAAAHSKDGRLLAFTGSGGTGLTVFDLTRHAKLRDFPLPPVERFAWSPDGRRIFCACAGDGPPFWVLDAETGEALRLPVRQGPRGGEPRWTRDNEVGFFEGERRLAVLDLDTLRLRLFAPSSGSAGEEGGYARGGLPETGRCALSVRPRIRSLDSPLEPGLSYWRFEAESMLAVTDKRTGASFPLLDAPIEEGTGLLVSPDASRITVVTGGGATTCYVGLGDADAGALDGTAPRLPEHEPDSPLGDLSRRGAIGAFVCAPLVNPLNGRVVGPDTGQVRALALWGQGDLRVAEAYRPVRPGDVAGCLHYWQNGSPVLLAGGDLDLWWSAVSPSGAARQAGPPPSFPRWSEPLFRASPSGIELAGWHDPRRLEAPPSVRDIGELASKPSGKSAGPGQTPEPAHQANPPVADTERSGAARVADFVRAHHRKVGLRDLDGFVGDYAEAVDLNDKGTVGPDFIRRDQAAYLPKYDGLAETVEGKVEVAEIAGGWRARYLIRSYAISRKDGREFDRLVRLTLDLRDDGSGGLEIFRERAAAEE